MGPASLPLPPPHSLSTGVPPPHSLSPVLPPPHSLSPVVPPPHSLSAGVPPPHSLSPAVPPPHSLSPGSVGAGGPLTYLPLSAAAVSAPPALDQDEAFLSQLLGVDQLDLSAVTELGG